MRKSENNTVLNSELPSIPNTEKIFKEVSDFMETKAEAKTKNNETSKELNKAREEMRTAAAMLEKAQSEEEYSSLLAQINKAKRTIDFLNIKQNQEEDVIMSQPDFNKRFDLIEDEHRKLENEAKNKIFEAAEALVTLFNDYQDKFYKMEITIDLLRQAANVDHLRPGARGIYNGITSSNGTIYDFLFNALIKERSRQAVIELHQYMCSIKKTNN